MLVRILTPALSAAAAAAILALFWWVMSEANGRTRILFPQIQIYLRLALGTHVVARAVKAASRATGDGFRPVSIAADALAALALAVLVAAIWRQRRRLRAFFANVALVEREARAAAERNDG